VEALYHAETKTIRCIVCNSLAPPRTEVDPGSAGASAHREYERRRAAREVRVKARLGNLLGGVALAIAGEQQTTTAWERGSVGERKLGEILTGIDGIAVLHDRRVPGTRGNLDHIVVAPAGVFVVDAKHYAGLIRIRDRGSIFNRDERLYVGSRDCSRLAENMAWQVDAVRDVVNSIPDGGSIPVQAVLCFVDGEWPLIGPPDSYKGVRLHGPRSIKRLLAEPGPLDAVRIRTINRTLSIAFPGK
jgi:nuclease-like protein